MAKLFQVSETKHNGVSATQTILLNAKKVIGCTETDTNACTITYKRFGNEKPDVDDLAISQATLKTRVNAVANTNTDGSVINVTAVDKVTGATSTESLNVADIHRVVPYTPADFETVLNLVSVENATQTGFDWYMVEETQAAMLAAANGS